MIKKIINIYKNKKEIINYLIFGVLTTIISLLTYYLLTAFLLDAKKELELQIANIISWIISVLFAYITNRKYVFESKNKNKLKEIRNFFTSRLLTLFEDMIIMYLGVSILKINDKFIKILSQIIVIVSNYILSKLFVFRKQEKSN